MLSPANIPWVFSGISLMGTDPASRRHRNQHLLCWLSVRIDITVPSSDQRNPLSLGSFASVPNNSPPSGHVRLSEDRMLPRQSAKASNFVARRAQRICRTSLRQWACKVTIGRLAMHNLTVPMFTTKEGPRFQPPALEREQRGGVHS